MQKKVKYGHYCVFLCLALCLFAKCILFQWEVFHSVLLSSVLANPYNFWSFWMTKVSVALLLASFVFFFKKNYWTIVLCLLVDFWIVANMMYLRSNGMLLNGYAFAMVGNMDGFWSSIWGLWQKQDILPFTLTILYSFFLVLFNRSIEKIEWKHGVVWIVIATVLVMFGNALVRKYLLLYDSHGEDDSHAVVCYAFYNPYTFDHRNELYHLQLDYGYYNFSVIHAALFDFLNYLDVTKNMNNPPEITQEERNAIEHLMGNNTEMRYDGSLIIVLVESMESWVVHRDIMPNLTKFIETHNVGYVKHVKSQISGGISADGQMIVNTGLLPIKEGAVCFRFPYIKFPSLVDRSKSATILTHEKGVWNQQEMSKAYGYTDVMEGGIQDSILFTRVLGAIKGGYKTVQAITVASHLPFSNARYSRAVYADDMPKQMADYAKCLNWTDEGLALLLNGIDSLSEMADVTVCITGDHSIFWKDRRDEFTTYCRKSGLDYDIESNTCPFIVYSPKMAERIERDELFYQMDIYPTILGVLGVKDYYWKGFGVDMLHYASDVERKVGVDEALNLSDKIIKNNIFKEFVNRGSK